MRRIVIVLVCLWLVAVGMMIGRHQSADTINTLRFDLRQCESGQIP